MKIGYRKEVKENLLDNNAIAKELVTEQDLTQLPLPVQKYLRYTGVVNKPKVKNVRIVFEGQMRDKGKNWFAFTSEQYNFFNEPTRLFFMKGKMFGVTVPGYHHYIKGAASNGYSFIWCVSCCAKKRPGNGQSRNGNTV